MEQKEREHLKELVLGYEQRERQAYLENILVPDDDADINVPLSEPISENSTRGGFGKARRGRARGGASFSSDFTIVRN